MEVIQRVMRHAKVSDRYVKVYRDDVRDAVQRNDRRTAARPAVEEREGEVKQKRFSPTTLSN